MKLEYTSELSKVYNQPVVRVVGKTGLDMRSIGFFKHPGGYWYALGTVEEVKISINRWLDRLKV